MNYGEHSTTDYAIAAIGGSLFASYKHIISFLNTNLGYTYEIDWAETFQVSWKAAVGAVVGLSVKWLWDKFINFKKKRRKV